MTNADADLDLGLTIARDLDAADHAKDLGAYQRLLADSDIDLAAIAVGAIHILTRAASITLSDGLTRGFDAKDAGEHLTAAGSIAHALGRYLTDDGLAFGAFEDRGMLANAMACVGHTGRAAVTNAVLRFA